jgi:hypothetical protein
MVDRILMDYRIMMHSVRYDQVIVFLATLALSFALSKWVVGKHGRATAAVLIALFVFCLVIRP